MSHIDETIARIPAMSRKAREEWALKTRNMLKKSPGHADALRLKSALEAAEAVRPPQARLEITGMLAWEKHQSGESTFRAFQGEREVGRIFKRADHSGSESEVYSVTILGQVVAEAIHHIRDARVAGEAAFRALSEKDRQ
ncbi:MAG TPA: hypothetical protein GX700_07360 [Paracoccus sp.]|nr:hypothetical protein [Paracoccus sp. (in: a-proteobacteria)]